MCAMGFLFCFVLFSFFFLRAGMEPRASHMLGKLSTTELHLQSSAMVLECCFLCVLGKGGRTKHGELLLTRHVKKFSFSSLLKLCFKV
jgi:hypothetical protein